MQQTDSAKPRGLWPYALIAAAALIWTGIGGRSLARHLTAPGLLRDLPAVPDLSSCTTATADQIRRADKEARERIHSVERVGHLGNVYQANLLYEEAAQCYGLSSRLAPHDYRWPYYVGLVHQTKGHTDKALTMFRHAAELQPRDKCVRLRLANALLKANRVDEARQVYQSVATSRSYGAHGVLGLARAAERERNWGGVIDLLAPAVERDPDFGPARHLLAAAYEAQGLSNKAREMLSSNESIPTTLPLNDPLVTRLEELSCSSSFLLRRAALARRAGDVKREGELLRRAADVAPDDLDVRLALGTWLRSVAVALAGKGLEAEARTYRESALDEAHTALSLAPNAAEAFRLAGLVFQDAGQTEDAIEHLRRAVDLDPRSHVAQRELGIALAATGDHGDAIRHCREAVRLCPGDPDYLTSLGYAYRQADELEKAIRCWHDALATDPDCEPAHIFLAQVLMAQGHNLEAAEHLRAVLADNPQHAEARQLLAYLEQWRTR